MIPIVLILFSMDEERPGRSSNTDTTQDRAKAYEVLVNAYYEGQQPAVTLSHRLFTGKPDPAGRGRIKAELEPDSRLIHAG